MVDHADAGEAPLAPPVRDRIMRCFGAWLDKVLAREPAPEGLEKHILERIMEDGTTVDRVRDVDLYSVVAGLTALTTEVKLQGRTFKELREGIEPMAGRDELLGRLAAAVEERLGEREEERVRQAERRTRSSLLSVLLDVRDRLERGLAQARRRLEAAPAADPPHRFLRVFSRRRNEEGRAVAALRAFETGYVLGMTRLDDVLRDMGVEVLESAPGAAFDPYTMNAVDVEETGEQPEGTVLEVYRTGYRWNGKVFRAAEVSVARAPLEERSSNGT